MSKDLKKYIAECIGTAILVLFGCGVAVITGGDIVPTALAFGLAIVAAAYAIGDISGCHVNPAVSLAMLLNKKLSGKQFCGYVIAQIIGALCGSLLLWVVLALCGVDKAVSGLGANAFIVDNAGGMWASILVEVILTFVFVYTILGVTSDKNKAHMAGLVIGLTLTFVHLLGIGWTGTSVNPARSLAPALLLGGKALTQVWVFILAPLVGGALAACTYKLLNKK
ncbi:aquaporin [Candidatus Saccharibacteria bacterium]|nr:aquaporin [Candidatus Saccharibacteria bacterium]